MGTGRGMGEDGLRCRCREALAFSLVVAALLYLAHDPTPPQHLAAPGNLLDLRHALRLPPAIHLPLPQTHISSPPSQSSPLPLLSLTAQVSSSHSLSPVRTPSAPRALSAAEATHATPTADTHAAAAPVDAGEVPSEPPHQPADAHAAQPPPDNHQNTEEATGIVLPPTVPPHGTAPPEAPVETHVPEAALGVHGEVHQEGGHGNDHGGTTGEGHEAAGHGTEHGEGGGHGEEHFNPSEGGLSFTLICIVMISLVLFFFVNSEDADIVSYTWDLLGKGINVFVSVMIFLIVVEICERVWPNWTWAWCTGLMGILLVTLIFANLHSIRAYNEIAIQPKRQRFVGEVNYNKITQKVIFSMTFGRIQAHLAAFTMIFFWGHIQHEIHSRHLLGGGGPGSVALVVPVATAFHLLVMAGLSFMRNRVARQDGEVDDDEKLWLHNCDETDIEAGGLELAFLAMQAIRFCLAGKMPTPNGNYHGRVPADFEKWWLLGITVVTGTLSLVLRRVLSTQRARALGKTAAEDSDEEELAPHKELSPGLEACFSVLELVLAFFSFLCGWALFFTFEVLMKTWDATGSEPGHEQDIMLIRTSVALMCSGVVFTIICCMDKIVDSLGRGHVDVTNEAEVIISVVGMMMGFGWERCFHHAFEVASGGAVIVLHQKLGLQVLFSELGVFVLTCSIMSVATILVLFWYINPRSMESRAKAKFDKAFPGGMLREESMLSEQGSGRDLSLEEGGGEGWLSSLFSSRPPQQIRGVMVDVGSEAAPPRQPRPKQRPLWSPPELPEEIKPELRETSSKEPLLTYTEEPQDTYEAPSYEAPVMLKEDPTVYEYVDPDAPEMVPFPKQRRRQEEYLASVGMYGQAYWAPPGPVGGPYGAQSYMGQTMVMPPMGPPGSLQMQPFMGPAVGMQPIGPPGSMQPQPGLLPPTAAAWQPSLSPPGSPMMVPAGPYWQQNY